MPVKVQHSDGHDFIRKSLPSAGLTPKISTCQTRCISANLKKMLPATSLYTAKVALVLAAVQ
jgi:hypothetical protein